MIPRSKEYIAESLQGSMNHNQSVVMQSSSLCKQFKSANLSVEEKQHILSQLIQNQKVNNRIKKELKDLPSEITPEWIDGLKDRHERIREEVAFETYQKGQQGVQVPTERGCSIEEADHEIKAGEKKMKKEKESAKAHKKHEAKESKAYEKKEDKKEAKKGKK